jgi:hypothetical protein
MIFEIMGWVATIGAITGAILNARKNVVGFYIWNVANSLMIICAIRDGNHYLTALFGVYLGISLYGTFNWRKKPWQK